MKIRIFIIPVLAVTLIFFLANAYAHSRYSKSAIKTGVKKIDKGIQVTITSDDPEVVKDIQENSLYYEEKLAYSDYHPHMEHMMEHMMNHRHANAYAHSRYSKSAIKTDVKKIDKGIQVTITSDDPQVAKDIQENSLYYEEKSAYSDYYPHMEHMMENMMYRHGCMMW